MTATRAADNLPDGSPADANLRFIGRWRHGADEVHGRWTGHYLRAAFSGTTVRVRIAADANLQAGIDGGPLREIRATRGVVDLTPTPLAPGDHTLLLTTRREEDELRFQGLLLDPGARTAPVRALQLIEFVGDSITANAGDATDYADFTVTNPFSWRVAELLGTDHLQIAQSGAPLVDGDRPGMASLYFQDRNPLLGPSVPWTAGHAPAIVVVNLGTNDRVGPEVFAATYTTFLRRLRATHPAAELVVLRPFGGAFQDGARQAVAALTAGGDTRARFIDTTGWLTAADLMDGTHPSKRGSLAAARRLEPILRALLAPSR